MASFSQLELSNLCLLKKFQPISEPEYKPKKHNHKLSQQHNLPHNLPLNQQQSHNQLLHSNHNSNIHMQEQ
jgi:hypothetical protein